MPLPLASLGGAAITSAAGVYSAFKGNDAATTAARRQHRFEAAMRSTQYQTAVEDMRKAGLNPALAYQQGGAGTPSGATADVPNPNPAAAGVDAGARSIAAVQAAANARLTMSQAHQLDIESLSRLQDWKYKVATREFTTSSARSRADLDASSVQIRDALINSIVKTGLLQPALTASKIGLYGANAKSLLAGLPEKQTVGEVFKTLAPWVGKARRFSEFLSK